MAYYFTSEELINRIRKNGSIPSSKSVISDEEILAFADDEMRGTILPLILSSNEDYYTFREEKPINGEVTHDIPYRAVGSKLRELGAQQGDTYYPLQRVSIDDLHTLPTERLAYFFLHGDQLTLHCKNPTGNLVWYYPMRPNRLVLSKYVGEITAITYQTIGLIDYTKYKLGSVPEGFESGAKYDFIRKNSNHGIITYDKVCDWDGTDILIPTSDVTSDPNMNRLKIGDQIAMANESNLIACPTDLQPVLVQAVTTQLLDSLGFSEDAQRSAAKLGKLEQNSRVLTENRVEGSSQRISNRNGLIRNRSRTLGRHRGF